MSVPNVPGRRLVPVHTTAIRDLIDGLFQWRIWGRLGWLEIKRRYRRTVIGPFWSAISLGVSIFALGSVGSGLWSQQANDYLPFLAAGMVVWVMVQLMIVESCGLFVGNNLFRQMRFNYSVMAYGLVYRNLIVFAHNLSIYLIVVAFFAPGKISITMLLVLPGLALTVLNCVWIAILLGMFCLRFRDLQQLIATLMQIGMFITPIFWPPESLTGIGRYAFIYFNPLYHWIDIIRAPLLGRLPAFETVVAVAATTILGWTLTITMFRRFRSRIAYWS